MQKIMNVQKNKQNQTSHFSHLTSDHRGITLIALIITIIVMIILVGVTVTVALNGGLFGTTQKAAYQTEVRTVQEQLEAEKVTKIAENDGNIPSDFGITISNLAISDELKEKYGTKLIVSKDGTLYYDPAVVIDEEERNWLEEIGIEAYTGEEIGVFEKYVLGDTPGTKNLQTIMNSNGTFIDEEETIADASTAVVFLMAGASEDETKGYIYAKYENVAYKIICDTNTYMTEGVEKVYTQQGREGQKYAIDLDGDGENEECTILSDYGEGKGIEIVAPTVVGADLTLGYGDNTIDWEDEDIIEVADLDDDNSLTNAEKSIYSYNNAVKTINDYCKEQVKNTNILKENIRSVGSNPSDPYSENTILYTSSNLETLADGVFNGVLKGEDTNSDQDFIKMIYLGIVETNDVYWLPSRLIGDNSKRVSFNIRNVGGNGNLSGNFTIFDVSVLNDNDVASGLSPSCGVRPVIKIPNV